MSQQVRENVIESITISGTTFIGTKRWNLSGRNFIGFTSTTADGTVKELAAYESSSELGFWRLFVYAAVNGSAYYKGLPDPITNIMGWDYVQQTFIHLDLQKYFDKVYSKLPMLKTVSSSYLEADKYKPLSEPDETEEMIKERVQSFHDKYPTSFNAEYGEITVDEAVKVELQKQEEIYVQNRFVNSIKNNIDDESRIEKIEPFHSYWLDKKKRCGEAPPSRNEDLLALSENIKSTFPTIGDPELVYDNFTFEDSIRASAWSRAADTTSLKGKIYKVKLGSADEKEIYLYFMIYSLKTISNTTRNILPLIVENKCVPIFLTTSSDATSFGLYTKYIVAGNYICKILEYNQQCLPTNRRCSHSYRYIGNTYDRLYPYQERKIQLLKVSSFKLPTGTLTRQGGKRKTRSKRSIKRKTVKRTR